MNYDNLSYGMSSSDFADFEGHQKKVVRAFEPAQTMGSHLNTLKIYLLPSCLCNLILLVFESLGLKCPDEICSAKFLHFL